MPGLLRGVARTAVIAGTATHVSNNVSRRQARRWSQEDASSEPTQQAPAPTAAVADPTDELKKYADLKDQGVITQEDYDAKKKQILGL